jgi:hypothetical protein
MLKYPYCYVYVFLLLCMFCSEYSVSLCCSVHCLCVNAYCTTATGCQTNCSKQTYQISNISFLAPTMSWSVDNVTTTSLQSNIIHRQYLVRIQKLQRMLCKWNVKAHFKYRNLSVLITNNFTLFMIKSCMKSALPEDEYIHEITRRKGQKCCAALMLPNFL